MISNFAKFYYVYVLISKRDKNFYVGYANNLKSRFEQHSKGDVPSTKYRRPLELVYFEACRDRRDAMHREKYLKTYLGRQFLRNRLKSYLTG
jgi:putative endonuclease